jgi:endonuclease YncB( thermonuclease family)
MGVSLALALIVAAPLVAASRSIARQSPHVALGHAVLIGRAEAVDGDTLSLGGIRVRLEGIDAPEADQTCRTASGNDWPCGREAQAVLANLVAKATVRCEERGLDKYKRILGVCRSGKTDINAELVRRGFAWAFVRYSRSYVGEEMRARAARIGIWSGTALAPWDYRAGRWRIAESDAPRGCPIKGNVTANGRIYHAPWSPWYEKIKMDGTKGKRWFCSEEEAVAAGWRPVQVN